MPTSPPSACLVPTCGRYAVSRGRCEVHGRTDAERGYGRAWRVLRARLRGSRCESCGATRDLTLDHRVPRSLGGTDDPANLRTLCRSCHQRIGLRSAGRAG